MGARSRFLRGLVRAGSDMNKWTAPDPGVLLEILGSDCLGL